MCVEIVETIYRWTEPTIIFLIILYLIWRDYLQGRFRIDWNSKHYYKIEVWWYNERPSPYHGRTGRLLFGLFKIKD